MTLLAPRPYSTFGLVPFLYASTPELGSIQSEYFKLSRKFHPDLMGSTSETASARLNFDYATLKDFWRLVESILHGAKIPQSSQKAALAPALAAEYFEAQDLWHDKGWEHPESRASRADLLSKVSAELSDAEAKVVEFAKRFPYAGFANAAAPWNEKDLAELNTLLQKVRYLRSFARDVEKER